MPELEHALELLATEVAWPATPVFDLRVAPRRRRRWLALAAPAAAALAAAFAVPDSRGAILRFLHLGGVTIERVRTLPPAEERPLATTLGEPVSEADAAQLLGRPFAFPAGVHAPLYRSNGVVSALFSDGGEPVLLSELRAGSNPAVLKKIAGASTNTTALELAPTEPAIWIAGAEHVFVAPAAPPRLAGNTLIWQRGTLTYRLEGKRLTLERAKELARSSVG
ncbi:MAG TPA: hypothetical protein VHD91_04335 [Gaiellaceae bacterium]|nr:hypothetical protein [Gaiellaceae bacterium]